MGTQPSNALSGATSKVCYNCGHPNIEQTFCGFCGSPLALNDYVTATVNGRLHDAIRDRDVLETESSIKVFEKALGWMKLLFGASGLALAIVGIVVGYQTWDFKKSADAAKQSVADAAKVSTGEISGVSAQAKRDVGKFLESAKSDINTASGNAVTQAHRSETEISKKTAAFRADAEISTKQLRVASELQPEIEGLRTKLAQTTSEVESQKKVLSSSKDFVKSVLGTHQNDIFFGLPQHQGAPAGSYVIAPPPNGQGTVAVYLLLKQSPIPGTLQLQFHVFAQQPNTFSVIAHNLVLFYWGEPAANLEGKQISASYFADVDDKDTIHALSEHDGRVWADDQPLPKLGQPDPDWKGNKWIPLNVPLVKP
jgi:hypothetical protein